MVTLWRYVFNIAVSLLQTANSWDCCDLLEINDPMIIGSNLQYHILVCMVLQDGKHSELIEKNGLYSRLARRQDDDLE
jgi:hypothetical protein